MPDSHWIDAAQPARLPLDTDDDAYELADHEFLLDEEPQERVVVRVSRPPPPLPRRRAQVSDADAGREHPVTPADVHATTSSQATIDSLYAELQSARAELGRWAARMRARDAYVVELVRALDERTRELDRAGIGTPEHAAKLLGRLRGQLFRIAELESELRTSRASWSALDKRLRALDGRDELQRIRGVGPRFAEQLRALGLRSCAQIGALGPDGVRRVAEGLQVPIDRIERERWVAQARELCESEAH